MTEPLPAAVVRISTGHFDPDRFAEVDAMNTRISEYLIPAVTRLPGLVHFYVGAVPEGSVVNVSVWDSEAHAAQMSELKEMTERARGEAEAIGVRFGPIINYPTSWTI